METITLAGGCFWCTEAVFERLRGVLSLESGYANGHTPAPTYDEVCSGRTGHAEAVQLGFDPAVLDLTEVLRIFFSIHDPTQLNRQGHDIGTQYRSGIYWSDPAQEPVIRAVLVEVERAIGTAVVTEVQALRAFHRAEAEHQRYFTRHPHQGYCAAVIHPKLRGLAGRFGDRMRDAPLPAPAWAADAG